MGITISQGIEIVGELDREERKNILTSDALEFVAKLERNFGERRRNLLQAREEKEELIHNGQLPDFLAETAAIRDDSWQVAPIPSDLQDRRVEITGPSGDRKMVINAFNSGAKVYMADFEDANSPTWDNTLDGQVNLYDAIRGTIRFENPDGKVYLLNEETATLIVRPRGWHLEEKHLLIDSQPTSGALFDFGLFFFHNAKLLLSKGSGSYFYLPKIENHLEARLWNDVFIFAQTELGIPLGSIKATVLIETILAAFEMDEILYELREHSAGLNCGRWDYIFSYIKKLRKQSDVILPDRSLVTMESPFMKAYSLLAIQTCHKRGVHCIGGMAAQIPIKNDPVKNEEAMNKVRIDKLQEVQNGHDGTWVAHPGLVPIAKTAFDEYMPAANQIEKKLTEIHITTDNLLEVPKGSITEAGVRMNISVGIQYLESWLRGYGAVPINNLMEDVATAEISRAQLWQWIHHPKGILNDGRRLTIDLFQNIQSEEIQKIKQRIGETAFNEGKFATACRLFNEMSIASDFQSFLTLSGYQYL